MTAEHMRYADRQAKPDWLETGALAACLVLSGAAGLIYEVIWLRTLSLVMGQTIYALSAVLTLFLGGLALGAIIGGRLIERRGTSLRQYAALELGIALSALSVPWLAQAFSPLFGLAYRQLGGDFLIYNLTQFAICAPLLLVPTMLMGATLPIVTALLLSGRSQIGVPSGMLYALNSFGGVTGAAFAGFLLFPNLGMSRTALIAAGLNLTAAGIAFFCARARPNRIQASGIEAEVPKTSSPEPAAKQGSVAWPAPTARTLTLLYGLSGFAALILEVGWTRVVGLSIGSTTYGFTIILVSFIAGLVAGSSLGPRLFRRDEQLPLALFLLHAIIALSTLLTLPYLGSLPLRVLLLISKEASFERLLGLELGLVMATIAIPTMAMGAMFPLVTQLLHRAARSSGRAVGSSYGANTIGNILGSFIGGFFLLPALGMRATIVCSAVLSAVVGCAYLAPAIRQRRSSALGLMAALMVSVAVAAVAMPEWDRELTTSGPFISGRLLPADASPDPAAIKARLRTFSGELIDYREGASTVVSVRRLSSGLGLQIGGVLEGFSFAEIHSFLANLPLLLHPGPRDVLVVGLGSGSTLASVLQHPVEHVDCVEMSPEVRDVARQYFSEANHHALDDPRVQLIIGDGRNHLRHCGRDYDAIISQPSHSWASGAGTLFTREFFADVRDHLRPGGIAASWFFTYSEESRRAIIKAWNDVFPNSYLFESAGMHCILIGKRDEGRLSVANIARATSQPNLLTELRKIGLGNPINVVTAMVVGPDGLQRYAEGTTPNTDDNARVEFIGLRGMLAKDMSVVLSGMSTYRQNPTPYFDPTLATPQQTAEFLGQLQATLELKGVR